VYEYRAGKSDWLAAGRPIEGEAAGRPTAATVARRDVPTCRLEESLRDVRARVQAAGWNACVVVNEARIVMGLLRAAELGRTDDMTIESAMRPGPSTLRPNIEIAEVAAFMAEHDLPNMPVTTSWGELVGLLLREEVEQATGRRGRSQRAPRRPVRARGGPRRPARRRRR
jgi:CBS domain-containing protein